MRQLGLIGLMVGLSGCGSLLGGSGCPAVVMTPSFKVNAPVTAGPGNQAVYVATAPGQITVESDGLAGSNGCNVVFAQKASLTANGVPVQTLTRSVNSVDDARQHPFVFMLDLQPGQAGVPNSGEVTWKLSIQSEEFNPLLQSSLPTASLNIQVR